MSSKIKFHFRCTAFGVAYYDCSFLDPQGQPKTVECCFKDGFVEDHPVLSYRYDVRIDDPEILAAWQDFCATKRAEYMKFLDEHPDWPRIQLTPFRNARVFAGSAPTIPENYSNE